MASHTIDDSDTIKYLKKVVRKYELTIKALTAENKRLKNECSELNNRLINLEIRIKNSHI